MGHPISVGQSPQSAKPGYDLIIMFYLTFQNRITASPFSPCEFRQFKQAFAIVELVV